MEKVTLRAVALWAVAVLIAVGASTAAVTLATNSVTQPPAVGLASPSDGATPGEDPPGEATPTEDRSPTGAATAVPSPADDSTTSTGGDDSTSGSGDPSTTQEDPGDDAGAAPSSTTDDDDTDDDRR